MTVKSIKCNLCGKATSRWLIVTKDDTKVRWCRDCVIKSGTNFETEYKKQVNSGVFVVDRERIKKGLPPE